MHLEYNMLSKLLDKSHRICLCLRKYDIYFHNRAVRIVLFLAKIVYVFCLQLHVVLKRHLNRDPRGWGMGHQYHSLFLKHVCDPYTNTNYHLTQFSLIHCNSRDIVWSIWISIKRLAVSWPMLHHPINWQLPHINLIPFMHTYLSQHKTGRETAGYWQKDGSLFPGQTHVKIYLFDSTLKIYFWKSIYQVRNLVY